MAENITLIFGTEANATVGVIQSESRNESVEVAEARGVDGKIIEQKAYSKTEERQFEALIDSAAALPAIGSELSVGSGEGVWKGVITSIQKTYSNNDYAKVSVTAQKKDAAKVNVYA